MRPSRQGGRPELARAFFGDQRDACGCCGFYAEVRGAVKAYRVSECPFELRCDPTMV